MSEESSPKSNKFVEIVSIKDDGVISLRRGSHRTLQGKTGVVSEWQSAYIQIPKDKPLVFGKVYDITQFGSETPGQPPPVVGQALCEQGEGGKAKWQVQKIFGMVPSSPGLG